MDIDPWAISAATLFAQGVLGGFTGEAGKSGWAGLVRLVRVIRETLANDPEGNAALAMIEARPTDAARIRLMAQVVQARANGDAQFRAAITDLVRDAESAGAISVDSSDVGMIAGREITQIGETNIGRDQVNYAKPD